MFIVTGATGALGRAIVRELVTRVPPSSIVASVRDAAKAQDLVALGVTVREADFADPPSLARAFEGATRVLLVSAPLPGHIAVPHHTNAIEAARAAGVGRVVYTSQAGASHDSAFVPMRTHAATEDVLRACGVPFTALRNGFYMTSALGMFGDGLRAGELRAPADGAVAWVAHADLAAAAAIALATDAFEGISPALTGAAALTLDDLAQLASEVTGRAVTRVVVSDDEYRASLVAAGLPPFRADMTLGMVQESRRGTWATVDPALPTLVGHAPVAMRDVLARALT